LSVLLCWHHFGNFLVFFLVRQVVDILPCLKNFVDYLCNCSWNYL
jgi:hypothetical protein